MVTRKPLPPNANVDAGLLSTDTAPNFTHSSPFMGHQYIPDAESTSATAWRSEASEQDLIPQSLRPAEGRRSMEGSQRSSQELPKSLRVGPPGRSPRSSGELQRPAAESTNPFIRRQQSGQSAISTEGGESSANAWGASTKVPQLPSQAPPPSPISKGEHIVLRFPNFPVLGRICWRVGDRKFCWDARTLYMGDFLVE
jgi:hypothetical protein